MSSNNFTTAILINQSPEAAFLAITNVRGWWSEEIEGNSEKLNDEFIYHYEDIHRAHMKLIEVIPNKKVVWQVLDNYFKFTKDETEWTGTTIVFDINPIDNQTEVRLMHVGLVPEYECYEICREGWTNYIQNSMYNLITTGKGRPNASGKPQTESERMLGRS